MYIIRCKLIIVEGLSLLRRERRSRNSLEHFGSVYYVDKYLSIDELAKTREVNTQISVL